MNSKQSICQYTNFISNHIMLHVHLPPSVLPACTSSLSCPRCLELESLSNREFLKISLLASRMSCSEMFSSSLTTFSVDSEDVLILYWSISYLRVSLFDNLLFGEVSVGFKLWLRSWFTVISLTLIAGIVICSNVLWSLVYFPSFLDSVEFSEILFSFLFFSKLVMIVEKGFYYFCSSLSSSIYF